MAKMSRRISGTGSAPIEISTLVSTAFIDCEVLAFHIKNTWLYYLVGSNPKSLSTYEIIKTLKTKLWYIKAKGLCIPSEINKLDT